MNLVVANMLEPINSNNPTKNSVLPTPTTLLTLLWDILIRVLLNLSQYFVGGVAAYREEITTFRFLSEYSSLLLTGVTILGSNKNYFATLLTVLNFMAVRD